MDFSLITRVVAAIVGDDGTFILPGKYTLVAEMWAAGTMLVRYTRTSPTLGTVRGASLARL
jgi:hypothetical protein